ncbi:MAG: ABC transporter ATP-binding protein/permease [Bdellovibrionales bacterium]|nr:ABC transporter ATP-binding protein/permease [Bdellovibrionales bacterium]
MLKMTTERILVQVQKDLQAKYLRLSQSFHSQHDSGSAISKTINDVSAIQWGLNTVADVIREPLLVVFLLAWIIYLDWKLTILLAVVTPIMIVVLGSLGRSVRKYSRGQQETLEKLTSTLKETLDGLKVIQSFRLEEEMKQRLMIVVDSYLHARRKIISRQESAGPITEFVGVVAFAGAAFYIGVEIIHDRATVGSFVSYIAALGMLQNPIKKIQDGYIRLQQTVASVDRIFEVLTDPREVPESANPKTFPENWDKIDFKDVSFQYHDRSIIKGINFSVRRGEVIAMVGESGSGKSTLMNLLERFIDPSSGAILIGGVDIRDFRISDLRSHIALVTQDVFLFNDSLETNIQMGNLAAPIGTRIVNDDVISKKIQDAIQLSNAAEFIEKRHLGLQSKAGERGTLLSGGERQRISIARAIFKNAPILILDEATSALDSASELEVQKGLDRLMEGRTTFVIAHRLSTVLNADRILVLDQGRVVESGTHDELLSKEGLYWKYVNLQML